MDAEAPAVAGTSRARSARERMPHMTSENLIGPQLKLMREAKGLSLEQFCQLLFQHTQLKMARSTLHKIECGTRVVYDYEVRYFAAILQVSMENLFVSF
ncbi:helix-turn-helix domain-containing protein [Deinococcus oregonensis]|uniref:Helix-turn-helix domain-containing protein n=1 Tax=Deinococcus oregonensis TaxID=1805970 RepID=A0ABV6AX34_9DEIO